MKKIIFFLIIISLVITACGSDSKKKKSLDSTLYKYAAVIRWSDFDSALSFLKPGNKKVLPSSFELERLKQFKVSGYAESPISPGPKENVILQNVEIQLYNIHTNKTRIIYDHQAWEYDAEKLQWYLISGIPKL